LLEKPKSDKALGYELDFQNVRVYNINRFVPTGQELEKARLIIVIDTSIRRCLKIKRLLLPEYMNKSILMYEKTWLFDCLAQRMFGYTLEVQKGTRLMILRELLNVLYEPSFVPIECEDVLRSCDVKGNAYYAYGTKEEVIYSLWEQKRFRNEQYNVLVHLTGAFTLHDVTELIFTIGEVKGACGCRYSDADENLIKVLVISSDDLEAEDEAI